ncbi:19490_t:CDS:2, partial [Racocetra persica]
ENHDATEEVNARKFFYNIVNAISNDSEASQEVQEYDIKEAIARWKDTRNKRILGDVTNLIPVPVAREKRKNYDANIIDISSKRMKVPVNSVTTFEASSNMQYLSPQNALACIPPILEYSPFACESKSTTSVDSKPPKEVFLWEDFLEKANEHLFDQQKMIFEKLQFHYNRPLFNEANICEAVNTNINSILNELMGINYVFSSQKPYVSEPDFTCYHNDDLIMVVEVKRKHILEKISERTLSEFYMTNDKAKMSEVLYISKTLPLQSKAPP